MHVCICVHVSMSVKGRGEPKEGEELNKKHYPLLSGDICNATGCRAKFTGMGIIKKAALTRVYKNSTE